MNLLNLFNVSHMYMCLGLITWDWIVYQGELVSLPPQPLAAYNSSSRGEPREMSPTPVDLLTGAVTRAMHLEC